jgi:PAS domain S-box-containing protein
MLTQIKQWLEPPHFDGEEEKTIQTRIANTLIIYLGAALLVVILILIPLFAIQKIGSWILSIIILCGLAIGRQLLVKGCFDLGSKLIFSVIYLCILAMLILSGGSSGTAMFYFAAVVLIAGFFLDTRLVNGFTIATFLIAMGISILQDQGLVTMPKIFVFNSVFSWLATGIGLLFTTRTRDLFVDNLKSAIVSAHQKNVALEESEKKYRELFEVNKDGIAIFPVNPHRGPQPFVELNEAAHQMLGYTRDEMLKLTPQKLEPQTTREQFAWRRAQFEAQKTATFETILRHKNGQPVFAEITTQPIRYENRPAIMSIMRDITERKRAEDHKRIIAEVQDVLLSPCELEDIYRLVAEKTKQLIGDGIAATSILDEKRKTLRMGCYFGVDIPLEKILQVIGFDPWQKEFPLDAMANEDLSIYRSSKLSILEGGLYALMTRLVPKPACRMLEKLLHVQKIYGMGFIHKESHLGGLVILARNDISSHIPAIEQMVNLATIAIERKRAEDEVKNSEKRFHALIAHGRDEISLLAADGTLLWESPSVHSTLGYAPNQFMGENIFGLMHPDDQARTSNMYAQVVQAPGSIQDGEFRLLHADGSWRWIECSATNLLHEPSVQAIVINYRDITERKRAAKALEQSETKYRRMVETTNEGVIILDRETQMTLINQQAANMLGYTVEELLGRKLESLLFEDDLSSHQIQMQLRAQGQSAVYERCFQRKDGSKLWTLISATATTDTEGNFDGAFGMITDITERKYTEEALRESEERIHSLFNNTTIGMYRTTPDGKILLLNPAGVRILGYDSLDEIKQRNLENEGFEPEYERRQFHEKMKRDGLIIGLESAWKRKDGASVYITESATAVKDRDGNILYYDGTFEDITERKRAEDETALKNKQLTTLNHLGQALNSLAPLPEIFERISDLIGQVLDNRNLYIALYDEATDFVSFPIYRVNGERKNPTEGRLARNGLTEYVIRAHAPVLISDHMQEELVKRGITLNGTPSQCYLGVPILIDERAIGMIAVQDYEHPHVYNATHVELLATIASQAANAIENARLYETIQQELIERKHAEEALRESQALTNAIVNSTVDWIWSVDPEKFGLLTFNDGLSNYFIQRRGIQIQTGMRPEELFPTDDFIKLWHELYRRALSEGSYTLEYGVYAKTNVLLLTFNLLKRDGEVFGISVFGRDITERKQAEEQIKKSLAEKETLLRELYHRTKNNMNVIIALLEMQSSYFEEERLKIAFTEAQNRIRSMALVHHRLYETSDLSQINLKDYIDNLMTLLMGSYSIFPERVSFVPKMEDVPVLIDTAIPCGLILNELISNALKYAFPAGRTGQITVELYRMENGEIQLGVSDDGVGLPPGFDIKRDGHLGMNNIFLLGEKQLRAKVSFSTEHGVACHLQFKDDLYQPRI